MLAHARERSIPVSDGSWRSEELLERSAQLCWFAQRRHGHKDGPVRQRNWREGRGNGRRSTTRHPHHAAVHVMFLNGLVPVAPALVWTTSVLHLNGRRLQHWARFCGHCSGNAARREGESRQKGEPEPAHELHNTGQHSLIRQRSAPGCIELTTRPGKSGLPTHQLHQCAERFSSTASRSIGIGRLSKIRSSSAFSASSARLRSLR